MPLGLHVTILHHTPYTLYLPNTSVEHCRRFSRLHSRYKSYNQPKKDETTDARHFCGDVLSLFSEATSEYSPISLRLIVYTTALEQLEGVAARFDQLHVGQYLFQYLTEFDSTSRRG